MEDCHDFRRRRGASTEDPFTAISNGLKFNKAPQCGTVVLDSRSWRAFTSTPCPPSPDPELFKEYSVSGHGGLTCAELSKGGLLALPPLLHPWSSVLDHLSSSQTSVEVIEGGSSTASDEHVSAEVSRLPRKGELVVITPVTEEQRALPTLLNPRPAVVGVIVGGSSTASDEHVSAEVSRLPRKGELVVITPVTGDQRALSTPLNPRPAVFVHLTFSQTPFGVIVAGSSTASDAHRSRKVELFDSATSECTEACDLPGPGYGLNEHQGGGFVDGTVLSIAFLKSGGRGVVGFDGKWVTCAIPDSCSCNTLQLVAQNNGNVYLFSERERGEHCIDELEVLTPTMWQGKNVIRVKTSDVRGLPVYPEQICLGLGDGKPYIINTLNGDGVVYDMRNGHGDSPAANLAEFLMRFLKGAVAVSIPPNIALGVLCNLLQPANAQQVTVGSSNPVDPAALLTSDTAKVAFVTALFAGGLGAAFIWKRFLGRPPTFTVASINAGLEATPPRVRREDLDSIFPLISDWALANF